MIIQNGQYGISCYGPEGTPSLSQNIIKDNIGIGVFISVGN